MAKEDMEEKKVHNRKVESDYISSPKEFWFLF